MSGNNQGCCEDLWGDFINGEPKVIIPIIVALMAWVFVI